MALAGKVIISMYYWTDLYLARDVPDERLAQAIASAFQVSPDRVAITRAGTPQTRIRKDSKLFAVVERSDRAAELQDRFPVALSIGLIERGQPFDEPTVLRAIAHNLGLPYVSDVEGDDEDTWRLILPNGETRPVTVDDDSRFTLSAADEAAIDGMLIPTPRIAS